MGDTTEIKYDLQGRMKYNPELHPNHKQPWTTTDERYLIEFYKKININELSLALGRTPGVICDRAYNLRKASKMEPRK
ncbi:MAG: hypothetical protein RPR91_08620 [Colwellia sp.]|jgi:hypothetical protein